MREAIGRDCSIAGHSALAPVLRLRLASIDDVVPTASRPSCLRCGSHAFVIHQRTTRSVKDTKVLRVIVIRYQCKKCGAVQRRYPNGVDRGRQSVGMKQLTILLYCLGPSYQQVRSSLLDLGCQLSTTTIRRNVIASGCAPFRYPFVQSLTFTPTRDGWATLRNSAVSLDLINLPDSGRQLDLCAEPALRQEVRRRLAGCAERLGILPRRVVLPPGSA